MTNQSPTPAPRHRVLFVCLGNICRSPAAEGIMRRIVEENDDQANWEIDSAGIGACLLYTSDAADE